LASTTTRSESTSQTPEKVSKSPRFALFNVQHPVRQVGNFNRELRRALLFLTRIVTLNIILPCPTGWASQWSPANPQENQKLRLLILNTRQSSRKLPIITQADFEECIHLANVMNSAAEAWKIKREFIRHAIANGASVELGVHTVYEGERPLIVR
jgi:hypothetical protein